MASTALRQIHACNFEVVHGAVVAVAAGEGFGVEGFVGSPDQFAHRKGDVDAQRPVQLLQRRRQRCCHFRLRQGRDDHAGCVKLAQVQGLVEQGCEAPAKVDVLRVHAECAALPAQVLNVAAAPQGATDAFGCQLLVCGQAL